MGSIGETLRRERLRTGLDLEKIAQDTKISVRMLELIEGDQFEKLPGGVFARSFVRQFAHELGIDEDEIVAELERRLAPPPDPDTPAPAAPKLEIRIPRVPEWSGARDGARSKSWLAALVVVVLVMLACSAAYTWWQKKGHTQVATAETAVAPRATPAPVAAPAPVPAPANPQPAPSTTPVASTPAPEIRAAAALPKPDVPPQPAAVDAPADAAGGAALRIALTADEATWVRATLNGKVIYSGVLQPNQTKALDAADTMTLRIGNAGGVSISLNGKAIPPVGPRGQVRIVQLSPDGGVQVEAPAPKPPAQQQTL